MIYSGYTGGQFHIRLNRIDRFFQQKNSDAAFPAVATHNGDGHAIVLCGNGETVPVVH